MSRKLATILLGFFVLATAFGPRLALANSEPVHSSCRETPKEMPTDCAIHCFTKAVSENKVEFNLIPNFDFFTPVVIEESVFQEFVFLPQTIFDRAVVFKDPKIILTTVKRE